MAADLVKTLSSVVVISGLLLGMCLHAESALAHKKFVIHVPLKMKSHYHTHTIYKHVHHGGGKVEYKVLGYSQSHGGEQDHHANGLGHGGDIIFNHFARESAHQHGSLANDEHNEWD